MAIEFVKDQLFIQLTTKRFSWPQTFEELGSAEGIDIIISQASFKRINQIPTLSSIVKRSQVVDIERLTKSIPTLTNGHTSVIAQSGTFKNIAHIFHPNKLVVLEEKYELFQGVFYVSTSWPYHKHFIKM